MKSSLILGSFCASLAVASPVIKRTLVTDWAFTTETVTVTGSGPAPTTTPAAVVPTTTAATTTTTQAAAPGVPGAGFFGVSQAQAAPTSTPSPVADSPPPAATPQVQAQSQAQTSSSSSSSTGGDVYAGLDQSYAAPMLKQHNLHRANHSASDLTWDDRLASTAQTIANSCKYDHQMKVNNLNYGQNIGAGYLPKDAPDMITNDMYNGEFGLYAGYGGEPTENTYEDWGHFTQIIWAGTTTVGCATTICSRLQGVDASMGQYFTVCNYGPPGNVDGAYGTNVLAPKGQSVITLS